MADQDTLINGPGTEFVSQTGRSILNLRRMLLTGEFPPGERLSELALVSRLGVSRTPIRLALGRLAQEGLVEAHPSGGFTVAEFSLEDIWDSIEMRSMLEGTAARLAAERLSHPAELSQMKRLQEQLDSISLAGIDMFARYVDLNEAFHSQMIELARSPMLAKMCQRLIALPFASASALVYVRAKLPNATQMVVVGQEHHHSIMEAIERRQSARAEAVAREHALLARRNLEIALSDPEMLNHVPGAPLIKRA